MKGAFSDGGWIYGPGHWAGSVGYGLHVTEESSRRPKYGLRTNGTDTTEGRQGIKTATRQCLSLCAPDGCMSSMNNLWGDAAVSHARQWAAIPKTPLVYSALKPSAPSRAATVTAAHAESLDSGKSYFKSLRQFEMSKWTILWFALSSNSSSNRATLSSATRSSAFSLFTPLSLRRRPHSHLHNYSSNTLPVYEHNKHGKT